MGEKKVLIVEDNTEFRMLLEQIVGNAGFQAFTAQDGAAGLEMARKVKPDMMLVDIQMPRLNGYELTEAVRADKDIGKTPIILVSVKSKMDEIVKGLKLGADDFVTKPFDPEEVVARMLALLRQSPPPQGARPS